MTEEVVPSPRLLNKNMPLVTIGLPTYNRPEGLYKALDGILAQDYPNLEIIISDNCSTNERVRQVILEYAAKDDRIMHFRQSVNIGLEENFNFVFAKSDAAYFTWMSDDDYFEANYVTECVKLLEAKPDHILCSGVAKYYAGEQFMFDEKMFTVQQRGAGSRVRKYFGNVYKNGNFYGVFRNKLLMGKPLGVHMGCDWSFMGRLAILGKLTYTTTTAYHRSAEGNSGTKKKMVQRFKLTGLKRIFFEVYLSYVIATNIFTDSAIDHRFGWVRKKWIITTVFFQINFKLVMNFIRKKLGLGKY